MPVETLQREIDRVLREMGVDDPGEILLERPRNPDHGDLATNVAMTLARQLRRAPRQIAEELVGRLDLSGAGVTAAEVAGPGFINFLLAHDYLREGLATLLEQGARFGHTDVGAGEPVIIEFVSANPTGPLHIGHGRQAALGDAVAELLAWCGWQVHREYYYNDAGAQIDRLAQSVWVRYQQHFGGEAELPESGYHGEYVRDLARELAEEHGERFVGDDSEEAMEAMRTFAVRQLMAEINRDLSRFRVHFDNYFLESSLYTQGDVAETIGRLKETGSVYEEGGALWMRTTAFGDDKDRVMVRSNGQPTYFLPDVAYHLTKWERGFRRAINVQGADHHGTVARVRAGLRALGLPEGYPEYVLHQMVTVMRGGEEVKFSKRAGSYVTFRDLFEEVGVDVTRYFFLMRRAEAQLVFDLDLALDQSEKNPVYKLQYAHARMRSIFRKAGIEPAAIDASSADLELLRHPQELEIIKLLMRFPEAVRRAAEQHAPHTLCDYLEEVAGSVNSWYHAGNLSPELRVLGVEEQLTRARLVLARAIQLVLRNGLTGLGISAPERLEREGAAS
ncbi:MAG: arginine--tRNA ligase [Longimicrobiaceae bacterium]